MMPVVLVISLCHSEEQFAPVMLSYGIAFIFNESWKHKKKQMVEYVYIMKTNRFTTLP